MVILRIYGLLLVLRSKNGQDSGILGYQTAVHCTCVWKIRPIPDACAHPIGRTPYGNERAKVPLIATGIDREVS